MLTVGDLVGERYRVIRPLGQGAAAGVFLANDLQLDRPVAVKLLQGSGMLADPARLGEEAKVLVRLRHPHVVDVLDQGVYQAVPYLVLEYVDGGTLQGLLASVRLGPERAAQLAVQLLEALSHAHREGVLHRDLKPENILLTRSGEPKLADFGLAKSHISQVRTASGIVVGTPEYMAPEVMEGKAAIAASDVYSLGCVLFHVANGEPPFRGSIAEIFHAKLAGRWKPGFESGNLAEVIRRSLQVDPAARGTAGELLALQKRREQARPRMGAGAPTLASSRPEFDVPIRGPRAGTRPVPWGLGLGLCGALLVFGLLGRAVSRWGASGPIAGGSNVVDPEPVRPVAPIITREPSRLVSRWTSALESVAVGDALGRLHREVRFAGPESVLTWDYYPESMYKHRRSQEVRCDMDRLRDAAARLPLMDRWKADKRDLLALSTDPAARVEEVWPLVEALQELGEFDAYYRAWGAEAPYGVDEVLAGIVGIRHQGPDPAWASPAKLEESVPLAPGRWLLFEWTEDPDRRFPWLYSAEGTMSIWEAKGEGNMVEATGGGYDPLRHRWIEAAFDAGEAPETRLGKVRLHLQASNHRAGNVLEVVWNGRRIVLHTPLRFEADWLRDDVNFPHYRVTVEVPKGFLAAGRNRIEVSTRPLRGLDRSCGLCADRLEIEAGPAPVP